MKKLISLLLAMAMVLSLAACGGSSATVSSLQLQYGPIGVFFTDQDENGVWNSITAVSPDTHFLFLFLSCTGCAAAACCRGNNEIPEQDYYSGK